MSLESLIKQRIQKHGDISVADYMTMCLTHPEYGYYIRRDPLGVAGDFTTSPEISQIFGELLGLWIGAQWQKQGKPKAVLAELGPGRGTLMADVLRATKRVSGFHDAISVHLVEMSPVLKQKQWQTLAGKHPRINWHDDVKALPNEPLFLIANEFFDALPIHQFVGEEERKVSLSENNHLCFKPASSKEEVRERSPASIETMKKISGRISKFGGAALVVDYGYTGGTRGDSLQALKKHAYHPVLMDPGEADITAHVDFDVLAQTARDVGAGVFGALAQGKFLLQIGASQRLMHLCGSANEEQKQSLMSGFERLISPEQMGELFKVLAIVSPQSGRPEGF